MNILKHIPNTLTVIRIILILPIVYYLFGNFQEKLISGILLVIGGFTDFLDGAIARKYNVETELGNFLDPLADKLMIISILIAFLQLDPTMFPYWMVWIIISREFLVTALRIGGIDQKKKVKTLYIGKIKTTALFLTIVFIIAMLVLKEFLVEKGIIKNVKGAVGLSFDQIWFNYFGDWAYFITYTPSFLLGISAILTIYSGISYLIKNKKVLFNSENKDSNE